MALGTLSWFLGILEPVHFFNPFGHHHHHHHHHYRDALYTEELFFASAVERSTLDTQSSFSSLEYIVQPSFVCFIFFLQHMSFIFAYTKTQTLRRRWRPGDDPVLLST